MLPRTVSQRPRDREVQGEKVGISSCPTGADLSSTAEATVTAMKDCIFD
jgi:hypothetical protein